MRIGKRQISDGHKPYIIAELSANHDHNLDHAVRTILAAKAAGADAIKLQTYTPDTLTIRSSKKDFQIKGGTLWDGKTLYDLYQDAYTPWEWHPKLQKVAEDCGIDFFSTPFDESAVDFLEQLQVPVYKIASFEIIDHALIRKVSKTGKPLILSTGMATLEEITEAVRVAQASGATEIALLKCTSAYPAEASTMNLRTIPDLSTRLGLPVGLSDHTLGISVPVAAIALGACIIEKHFTLSRSIPGPDSSFSLEPSEFKAMVDSVHTAFLSLGQPFYGPTESEAKSAVFRRSLFIVKDIKAGETLTREHVRSIRPGTGLPPKYLEAILGTTVTCDVERGTPVSWNVLNKSEPTA